MSKLVKLTLDKVPEPAYNKHIDSNSAESITHTGREFIMLNIPNTVKGMADALISHVEKTSDKFELHENEHAYYMIGKTPEWLLDHTYKNAKVLTTAIESFAVMATIFSHYGASDKLTQEWFEYNLIRWSNAHNVSKKTFTKVMKQFA